MGKQGRKQKVQNSELDRYSAIKHLEQTVRCIQISFLPTERQGNGKIKAEQNFKNTYSAVKTLGANCSLHPG
jgi:formate-dependent nitrite reductase cytochrome c552 subunit